MLAGPARNLSKRAVSQDSCSMNELVDDLEGDGGDRHKQAGQRGYRIQPKEFHYSICSQCEEQEAKREKHEDTAAGGPRIGAEGLHHPAQPGEAEIDRKSTR